MNPARALAPALLSGTLGDLWLYWTAPFVGTIIAAFLFRGKFQDREDENFQRICNIWISMCILMFHTAQYNKNMPN